MTNEQISLKKARNLGVIMQKIRAGEHIELTDYGHPIAVIIPIDDYRKKFTTPEPNTTGDAK